ncbi:response regulator [bacterium]|nr:response regulator [bacterium]
MCSDYKILIVDDDPMNIDILMDDLEDLYTLRSAESGEEALQIIPEFHPDLILLDIMMSGIDGYEVCRRIRTDKRYNAIKIILISGRAMEDERQKGYAVGADDYVTKPFEVEELVERIRVLDDLKNGV